MANPSYGSEYRQWERRATNRRNELATTAALSILAGAWLLVSPTVVSYVSDAAAWNAAISGGALLVIGLAGLAIRHGEIAVGWATAVIGVWLFVSGLWLGAATGAGLTQAIVGVMVFLLAIFSISAASGGDRQSGPGS